MIKIRNKLMRLASDERFDVSVNNFDTCWTLSGYLGAHSARISLKESLEYDNEISIKYSDKEKNNRL